MTEILDLNSSNTTFILSITNLIPKLVYWGERLYGSTGVFSTIGQQGLTEVREPPVQMDTETKGGYFSLCGLEGFRNGLSETPVFETIRYEKTDDALTIVCRDLKSNLEIVFKVIVDEETDIVEFNQCIKNIGNSDYQLNQFCYAIPLCREYVEIVSYSRQKSHSIVPMRYELDYGQVTYEDRGCINTFGYSPFWLIGTKGFSESIGNLHGFHLAWSGNHFCRFGTGEKESRTIEIGELLRPGDVRLQPGEVYECPSLFGVCSNSGIGGISKAFHLHIRQLLADALQPRQGKVSLRLPEEALIDNCPYDFDDFVNAINSLGIERFVLERNISSNQNSETFNQFFKPLIKKIKKLNIEFGVAIGLEWFFISRDVLKQKNTGYSGTEVDALDLRYSEVFANVIRYIDYLTCEFELDFIELEVASIPQTYSSSDANRRIRALYNLLNSIKKKHPNVVFESLSPILGHIDLRLLSYVDRFWIADKGSSFQRLCTQNSFSVFFPPELSGNYINCSKFQTPDQDKVGFRLALAIFGSFGIEIDLKRLSSLQLASTENAIKLHKEIRPILYSGDFFRLLTPDESLTCWQIVSQRQDYSVVGVFQTSNSKNTYPAVIKLRGLFKYENYNIEVVYKDSEKIVETKRLPNWMSNRTAVSGEWLIKGGIQLPKLRPEGVLIVKISKAGVYVH